MIPDNSTERITAVTRPMMRVETTNREALCTESSGCLCGEHAQLLHYLDHPSNRFCGIAHA